MREVARGYVYVWEGYVGADHSLDYAQPEQLVEQFQVWLAVPYKAGVGVVANAL